MKRRLITLLSIFGCSLAIPASVLAHVSMKADTTASGAYSYAQFSVSHGCEEKATTKMEIQVPEEVLSYKPQVHAGWDLETSVVKRDEPIKAAHGDITERVETVTYTAKTPLPDGYLDVFGASIQWPEDADGDQLNFPVIQTCEGGLSNEWIDIAKEGEDEPENPAPFVTVSKADADEHGHDDTTKEDAKEAVKETDHKDTAEHKDSVSQSDLDSVRILAIVGVALGGVSVLLLLLLMGRVKRLSGGKDK
jgi:uncharacterized protein YcnI